mmetsp:Transcript_86479/g.217778  ORF Transcript_86479/g.217778 Transcript_86479/m.217778 type:complete len:246 (+) Transcript_86479:1-738(+)
MVYDWASGVGVAQGSAREAVLVITMRASPAGYFHIFIAGILSARIFILSATYVDKSTGRVALDGNSAPMLMKYGCCLGYLLWGLLIFFDPDIPYLIMHQGGLIPIMFLIIIGAAVGVDPLTTWIFKSLPLIILGRISYVQYLTQRSVWDLLRLHFPTTSVAWAYPFVLVIWAYLVQRWVESPYTEWQRVRMEKDDKGFVEKCIAFLDDMVQTTRLRRTIVTCFLLFLIILVPVIFWFAQPGEVQN